MNREDFSRWGRRRNSRGFTPSNARCQAIKGEKHVKGMESAATAQRKRSLLRGGGGVSFRLRSPSLNSVRLRRIFDIFDKNKDNILSLEELGQALGLLGLETDLSELKSMMESYVEEGKGGLRYEDFEALHRSLNDVFFGQQQDSFDDQTDEESDLSEAFKVFDEDGDGYISARELQVVLSKLGLQEGREIDRVHMMISSVDKNHDGRVDFLEFKDMMRTTVMLPC